MEVTYESLKPAVVAMTSTATLHEGYDPDIPPALFPKDGMQPLYTIDPIQKSQMHYVHTIINRRKSGLLHLILSGIDNLLPQELVHYQVHHQIKYKRVMRELLHVVPPAETHLSKLQEELDFQHHWIQMHRVLPEYQSKLRWMQWQGQWQRFKSKFAFKHPFRWDLIRVDELNIALY